MAQWRTFPTRVWLPPVLLVVAVAVLTAPIQGCWQQRSLRDARALQEAGRFQESIAPLRETLARDPEDPRANLLLGVALLQTGEPRSAVAPLERARALPEQRVVAGLLLTSTLTVLQAHEQAIAVASELLASDPALDAARRLRAVALLAVRRPEEALVDAEWLVRTASADTELRLLRARALADAGRREEAEQALAELEAAGRAAGDEQAAHRTCTLLATFLASDLQDAARAEVKFRACLAEDPADVATLHPFATFLDERGRSDEATRLWQQALDRAPDDETLRRSLASRYQAAGRVDDARALLREGARRGGGVGLWIALADLERRRGRADAALAILADAEQAGVVDDELLLFRASLLVEADRLDEAEALADRLEAPAGRALLRGRVQLARGEPEAALASLEEGLRELPNHATGRYFAALAAHRAGDLERAVAEARASVRANPDATDAALLLAMLEAARGQHEEAIEAAESFVARRGRERPNGYLLLVRSQQELGRFAAARETSARLRAAGFPVEAALAAAEVEVAAAGGGAAGAAAGLAALDASGLDPALPVHEPVLRKRTELLLGAGRGAEALAIVDRALAHDTGRASLHELRGTLLVVLDRHDEAREAFEAALARDAANLAAHQGLATLAAAAGDLARATALLDEAARLHPDDVAPAYAAAQLTLQRGDRADARRRLETIVAEQPLHAPAANDLAWILATEREDLDRALVLAQRAHRLQPSPETVDTLGRVRLERGELDLAVPLFESALDQRPRAAGIRYHLGLALARRGDRERAVELLRAALAAGPFPEAAAAREELARLEGQ